MDYSFLRFEDSLDKAKKIKVSPMSSIYVSDVIQLLPSEFYLQVTNLKTGISFGGDYQALLIDCEGNTLNDVTPKVAIYEFTDSDGINQIAFELFKLELDYGKKPIHLKLIHTTGTDVYYTNSFCLTNVDSHKTTRFDYKHRKKFYGISYDVINYYQSIRLVTWFAQSIDETEVGNYYQISNGNTISNRPLYKQAELYKCELMNDFIFERANIMLLHDIVYVDGVRMTNKTTFKSGEFLGDTNIYKTDVKLYKNYNEVYTPVNYIYEVLSAYSKIPIERPYMYTLNTFQNEVKLMFNKVINLNTGTITIKNSLGSVVASSNQVNFIISSGTNLNWDFSATPITTNGIYTVEVSANLVNNLTEFNSFITWDFEIINPEYEPTEYDNLEYLV